MGQKSRTEALAKAREPRTNRSGREADTRRDLLGVQAVYFREQHDQPVVGVELEERFRQDVADFVRGRLRFRGTETTRHLDVRVMKPRRVFPAAAHAPA